MTDAEKAQAAQVAYAVVEIKRAIEDVIFSRRITAEGMALMLAKLPEALRGIQPWNPSAMRP